MLQKSYKQWSCRPANLFVEAAFKQKIIVVQYILSYSKQCRIKADGTSGVSHFRKNKKTQLPLAEFLILQWCFLLVTTSTPKDSWNSGKVCNGSTFVYLKLEGKGHLETTAYI